MALLNQLSRTTGNKVPSVANWLPGPKRVRKVASKAKTVGSEGESARSTPTRQGREQQDPFDTPIADRMRQYSKYLIVVMSI